MFADTGKRHGRQKQSSVWIWLVIQVSLDNLCLPSVNWNLSRFQSFCLQSTDFACTLSPWITWLHLPLWTLQTQTSPTVIMAWSTILFCLSQWSWLPSRFLLARVWSFSMEWFLFLSPLIYNVKAVLASSLLSYLLGLRLYPSRDPIFLIQPLSKSSVSTLGWILLVIPLPLHTLQIPLMLKVNS